MKRITAVILSLFLLTSITACDDDDDDHNVKPPEKGTTYLRVIHGSADAPKVNIMADGAALLSDVDFEQGSGFIMLDEGNYSVSVDAILPDMSTTQVLDLGSLALMPDTEYTVLAHGWVADGSLAAAAISNEKMPVSDGNIRMQVIHAAPNAPAVDLHVTGVDDELSTPLATLAYGDVTGQVEVPAGTYRVRLVLPDGTEGAGAVAFDVALPDLAAGTDLFVAAVPNVGVTTSPVALLANTGETTLKFIDDRTQAWVRVGHTAADVPNVDILVDDTKVDALSNTPFAAATGYVPLDMNTYMVDTVLTADNSVVGITGELNLMADSKYSVFAVGTLSADDEAALEYYVLEDNIRAVATEVKLRLTHAHPSVGNVDIYVTADGMIDSIEPAFSNVPYMASTGFITVAAGDYVVQITPTGAKTPIAIDTGVLSLEAGKVYSAVAINNPASVPANLLLMDDFVAM